MASNDFFNYKSGIDLSEISAASMETLFERHRSSAKGLSSKEVSVRLLEYGFNETARKRKRTVAYMFFSKFLNPLVVVLILVGIFSLYFGEKIEAVVVFLMIASSVILSFVQEYRSGKEAEHLAEMVRATSTVYRNGRPVEIKIRDIVPGDIVDLYAGDIIPADIRIIQCKDLFINQAALTGESMPVEKFSASVKATKQSDFINICFMGSTVQSGTGLGLVIATGTHTKFGEISKRLTAIPVETAFDRGIRDFTWMVIRMMIVIATLVFAINAILKGNLLEAFLFSIAVAVGLTPEMLPMLVTINLSKGAIMMSRKQVIVKRLNSIQNFGAMNILCTDKTGTLTEDKVVLEKHCDVLGKEDDSVLRYAYINSFYQTGLKSLLDRTILKHEKLIVSDYRKVDEIPFDFSRKIMSVVVENNGNRLLVSKGAPEDIIQRCTKYELDGQIHDLDPRLSSDILHERVNLGQQGFRVLAVSYRIFRDKKETYSRDDEKDMVLKGYLAFLDPPKPTAKAAIESLHKLGIEVKILTGDNEIVTKKIAQDVGMNVGEIVTGNQLDVLNDTQLQELAEKSNIFARLTPLQKERIINILRKNKHVVGYLGDGINDAPALKAADIGVSVNNAADIAREAADIILLKKSLRVIKDGILEGRKVYGNIVKYIKMGSSSNFGNMFSMIGASIFLPFLPMAPLQILLNNFLYDMSQVAIPTDEVDEDYLEKPKPWRVDYIKKFMVIIGPISSIFDYLTYAIMWFIYNANTVAQQELFRAGWFLESICTQTLVIYIIRTEKTPFIESKPSKALIMSSLLIVLIAFLIIYTPISQFFGFKTPPASYILVLEMILVVYLLLVHKIKKWFIRKYGTG